MWYVFVVRWDLFGHLYLTSNYSMCWCVALFYLFPVCLHIAVWNHADGTEFVCACVCGSSVLEGVTHEAWCLGLPAALVSSSAEALTVGLKSEGGGEEVAGKSKKKGGERWDRDVERQGKGQCKKRQETENSTHFKCTALTPSTRCNKTSYRCSFLVSQQTHVDSMYSLCIWIQEKKNKKKQRCLLTNISVSRMLGMINTAPGF